MSLPQIRGSAAVITGASSGIGRAAAREFARAGARVVLAARNEERLGELAREIAAYPAEALAVATDVTRDDQVLALAEAALDRFGAIDILICNAGVGLYSPVRDLPQEALRRAFEVNFFGALRCVQAALPSMLRRRSGLVQIVSSVIGLRSVPGYAGYCATKFALSALAESLRVELAGSGIRVQMIYPGLTATEFPQNSLIRDPRRRPGPFRPMPAETVARVMRRAAQRGSRDRVITAAGRLLTALNKISPRLIDLLLARVMAPGLPEGRDALPDRRE